MAATIAMLAGCFVAVTAVGAAGAGLIGSVAAAQQPSSGAEIQAGEADPGPTQPGGTVNPEGLSTGPVLEWTEIDPGFADLYAFESLDSGRVLARAWYVGDELSLGGERAVYTDNGADWTELPLPEGIVVRDIDNGSTVEQASEPETSLDDLLVFDAYVVDNGFVVTAVDDVLSVQHATSGKPASTTATFEGLFPTWNLAAGSAGVAMTAFPSLGGQLEASTIGGLPVWRDFDRIGEPTGVPLWIGWSADAIDWGWQSLPDAFGITEGEPWAQLAVGRDFVIARVETIISPTPEELAAWQAESCSGSPCSEDACSYVESLYGDAPPLRWFIARVP